MRGGFFGRPLHLEWAALSGAMLDGYLPFTLVRDRSAQARALPPSHTRYRPTARPRTLHTLAAHSARLTQLA